MRTPVGNFTMRRDGRRPGGDWFSIKNKVDDRTKVYIYDEIGFWGTTAQDFVDQLNDIDSSVIELHVNSPGGAVFDGIAIYNALKQHKATVEVYVDSLAASAASFIAQAGDKVIMARNAEMMIHDGIAMAYGNEADLLETAELLGRVSDNISDIYHVAAFRRGHDISATDFRALMKEEVWYFGKEAVVAGLADEVTDTVDEEADTENKWDLGIFNYAGREAAESPLRVTTRVLVTNRSKEKQMGDEPKNDDQSQGGQGGDPAPAPDPEPTPAPAAPTPPADTPPQSTEPANAVVGVLINGQRVTDPQAIQNHIDAQTEALTETKVTARTNFVAKLSDDKKIPATQVTSLTKLAVGMTDEQYAEFAASYESVTPSPLFNQHAAAAPGDPATPGTPEAAKKDRIEVLESTVSMLSVSMTEEQVQNTKAYKELTELRAQN